MASEFKEDVPEERLQIWRDWIRERAGDPSVLRSMSLEDAIALAKAMDMLGDARSAKQIVTGYCCGTAFPKSFGPSFASRCWSNWATFGKRGDGEAFKNRPGSFRSVGPAGTRSLEVRPAWPRSATQSSIWSGEHWTKPISQN